MTKQTTKRGRTRQQPTAGRKMVSCRIDESARGDRIRVDEIQAALSLYEQG